MHNLNRFRFALAAAALSAIAIVAGSSRALAVGGSPSTDVITPPTTQTDKGTSTKKPKKAATKKEKQSGLEWINQFWAAHRMIVDRGEYEAGIKALHALHADDHPDVATYLGYASRKLGRYEEAKYWYDKALAADPNHTRTIAYYGMWHLEQGNRLKAEEELEKIANICGGTGCREYKLLKAAIDGKLMY
jgi:tetratricopeptide (TPR) repeat protein